MATKEELATQHEWAEEIRVAATWITGVRATKLEDLANRIDPEVTVVAEPDDSTPEPGAAIGA